MTEKGEVCFLPSASYTTSLFLSLSQNQARPEALFLHRRFNTQTSSSEYEKWAVGILTLSDLYNTVTNHTPTNTGRNGSTTSLRHDGE